MRDARVEAGEPLTYAALDKAYEALLGENEMLRTVLAACRDALVDEAITGQSEIDELVARLDEVLVEEDA